MKKNTASGPFGLRRLLPWLQGYRIPVLLMLLTSAAGSIVDIGVPIFQRYALNRFVVQRSLQLFPLYLILYLAVVIRGYILLIKKLIIKLIVIQMLQKKN